MLILDRLLGKVRFSLERWVQRGVIPQLLLMAGMVFGVAVAGGVAAWSTTAVFESLPEAVWWSFLRLTDPGYLGDDEGTLLRVISTIVTVLGYVLFMGSLIAILTQWLSQTLRDLESGRTPITMKNHFVILGWTNRTPETVKRLVHAGGRRDRLLARRGGPQRLRIVVLADEVDAERHQMLRDSLGEDWSAGRIFLRSGSSLQLEHLSRLDLMNAAMILVPGADFESGGADLTDTRVVKTLLTLDLLFEAGRRAGRVQAPPHVVAELFDPDKLSIAQSSLGTRLELIAGDRLVSRLLSQSIRQQGMAPVLLGLLNHRVGNSLYVSDVPELVGVPIHVLERRFAEAVILGRVSTVEGERVAQLNLGPGVVLERGDQLVLLAESFAACRPGPEAEVRPDPGKAGDELAAPPRVRARLLILGWSLKTRALLSELADTPGLRLKITILSKVAVAERERELGGLVLGKRATVEHRVGDYSLQRDLGLVQPESFDHVLFMASAAMHSSAEADARTVLGALLLRSLLAGTASPPEIAVEILDPENASLLEGSADAVFVSPRLLSHLLAHIGMRPELNAVYDELICAGGVSLELHPVSALGDLPGPVCFADLQHAARVRRCTVLGLCLADPGPGELALQLNPDRASLWNPCPGDQVVLLATERAG